VNSWGIAPIATPIDPPLSLPAYIIVQWTVYGAGWLCRTYTGRVMSAIEWEKAVSPATWLDSWSVHYGLWLCRDWLAIVCWHDRWERNTRRNSREVSYILTRACR